MVRVIIITACFSTVLATVAMAASGEVIFSEVHDFGYGITVAKWIISSEDPGYYLLFIDSADCFRGPRDRWPHAAITYKVINLTEIQSFSKTGEKLDTSVYYPEKDLLETIGYDPPHYEEKGSLYWEIFHAIIKHYSGI